MKKNPVDKIENISLSAKQIKNKLEDCLAYDHDKLRNVSILFTMKPSQVYKLPFSDFKISISEEMYGQELLLEDIKRHISEIKLLEEKVEVEIEGINIIEEEDEIICNPIDETVVEEVEEDKLEDEEELCAIAPSKIDSINDVNIVEEIEEDDEYLDDVEDEDDDDDDERQFAMLPTGTRAKRPKGYTIKVVDVEAIIKKIKEEAIAKNAGKPVIGRRQINKLLKPYMLKQNHNMDIDGIDNTLTSIDIYLNAVDKISTTDIPSTNISNDSLKLNLDNILDDLENN